MTGEANIAHYTPPRYARQWIITLMILGIALAGFFRIQHPRVSKSPEFTAPLAQESYWFFVVQLPNPEPHASQAELHQKISDWLTSLHREGFHPMLLSEVTSRLSGGMLLPKNTVVISIDEALLTTYKTYMPLLRDFKVPAVLVTSLKPLERGDHGYLSYYEVRKLSLTDRWEVILLDDRARPKVLSPQKNSILLPLGISPWSSDSDHPLANQLADLQKPRRLYVDWRWSGQDLIHRLQSESLVYPDGSRLGAGMVTDRLWGIVLPKETGLTSVFSLQAPADQHGTDVEWPGTRGIQDFQLNFSIGDATGEVWFLMRSTGDSGDSIRVGFSSGKVLIKQYVAGHEYLLGMTDWPHVFPWKGTIRFQGSELELMRQGQIVLTTRVRSTVSHPQALLQLMVYEQLYGTAQARDVSLEIIPLL